MGMQEAPYSLRLEKETMEKVRALAAKKRRSINMQICVAIEHYLEDYEKRNGPILPLEENEH